MRGQRLKTITITCKCCLGTGQELDKDPQIPGGFYPLEQVCEACQGEGTVEVIKSGGYHLVEVGPACAYTEPFLMEDFCNAW